MPSRAFLFFNSAKGENHEKAEAVSMPLTGIFVFSIFGAVALAIEHPVSMPPTGIFVFNLPMDVEAAERG